jgi:Ni,Fe-hydrogenase I large subunit
MVKWLNELETNLGNGNNQIFHSFDPCIACGVHVIDTSSSKTYSVKVV